jgi:hypothetical protein
MVTGTKAFAGDYAVFEYRFNPDRELVPDDHPCVLDLWWYHVQNLLEVDPSSRPSAADVKFLNELTAFVLSPDESGIGLWESTAPPISKFPSIIELSMEVAAIHRRVDIVARILANSANSWTPDLSSIVIQSTICCDSWAVLKTLLEAGWDAGQCLCIAAECDSASAIKVILEAGFSVDTMHHGRTALQMAIRRKNHYAIMTLLEAGSDVALLTDLYYSEPTHAMFVGVLIEDMRTIRQMYELPSWRIQVQNTP